MDSIQNEKIFVKNLIYMDLDDVLVDSINQSNFFITPTGRFSDALNFGGATVYISAEEKIIKQWKSIEKTRKISSKSDLISLFNSALDQDTDYKIMSIIYRISNSINQGINFSNQLLELMNKISNGDSGFQRMSKNEKLATLVNGIENLLKKGNKFTAINEGTTLGYLTNKNIKDYRKKFQAFRHASNYSLDQRNSFTDSQKDFLINYGKLIIITIYENDFK